VTGSLEEAKAEFKRRYKEVKAGRNSSARPPGVSSFVSLCELRAIVGTALRAISTRRWRRWHRVTARARAHISPASMRYLAAHGGAGPLRQTVLRARGSILELSELLTQHASYFDGGV
jgi:hypothetical protein